MKGGNNHKVWTGDGKDTVTVTGGSNHWLYLGSKTNTVTVSATNVTIQQDSSASVDNITVQWSEDIEVFTFKEHEKANDIYKNDKMTITGAKSTDFNFGKQGGDDLVLSSLTDPGCGIIVEDWNRDYYKGFLNGGIQFDDRYMTFAQVNEEAGFA